MNRTRDWGLAVGIWLLMASPGWTGDFESDLAAGRKAVDDGNYEEAIPHFERAEETARAFGEDDERHLDALNWLADALSGDDQNSRAESIVRQALELAEKKFGKESAQAARSLRILGDAHYNVDRSKEAEECFTQALKIRQKVLGPDHPDTAESLNIVGNLAVTQQRYRDGEKLLHQALAIYEKTGDLPKTATVRNNLGYLYSLQENYRQSETEYRKSLEIRQKALRTDHPDIGAVCSNLADACSMQGKDAEAESLLKEAVRIAEKNDPEGSNLGYALHNLACLYAQTQRFDPAFPLFERSRAIWEKTDGPESDLVGTSCDMHAQVLEMAGRAGEAAPLTARAEQIRSKPPADPAEAWQRDYDAGARALTDGRYGEAVPAFWKAADRSAAFGEGDERNIRTLLQLATALRNQPDYPQAESVGKRALASAEKALGRDAPELAGILNILALLYSDQDRAGESEPLYQRALAIRMKALGPDHPDTAQSIHNLASILQEERKYDEAEKLFRKALAIYEKINYQTDVAFTTNALGYLHMLQEKTGEAEKEFRDAMARYERAGMPDTPAMCDICFNLGDILRKRNDIAGTEQLLQRALGIAEKLGPDHPHLAKSLHNLAVLYMSQGGRDDEADGIFRRSRAIWERINGPNHPLVAQSLDNHARLLEGKPGREGEVAEMRRRVEEIRQHRQ
jgi:tetratricopeptide (TPR) repeat protein